MNAQTHLGGDRTRRNGCKLKYRKFSLSRRRSCEGSQTVEQVAQRGCGLSIFGDTQNLTGHGPGQPAVADPALSRGLALTISPSPLPPQPFCDSGLGSHLLLFCNFVHLWQGVLCALVNIGVMFFQRESHSPKIELNFKYVCLSPQLHRHLRHLP